MRRGKKILSVLLILAMLSSMLTGFAVLAAPQSKATPVNLILGKTPTVSSYTANNLSALTDGNHSFSGSYAYLLYGPGGTQDNENYFEFSFDQATALNQIKLYRCNQETHMEPRDIVVDVKLESGAWRRVVANYNIDYSKESVTNDIEGVVQDSCLNLTFETVECMAFRVTSDRQRARVINNKLTSTYNWKLTEIEAYNNPSVTSYSGIGTPDNEAYSIPMLSLSNLAAGKTVTTNGHATNKNQLALLTDGSASSGAPVVYFNTAGSTATNTKVIYFDIDMGSVQRVNRVDLTLFLEAWAGNEYGTEYMKRDPRDIAIDVLDENSCWIRVAEEHNLDYGTLSSGTKNFTNKFYFDMVQGSKIRISFNRTQVSNYMKGATGGPLVSPSEVQVYCDYGVAADQHTGVNPATVANTEIPTYSLRNYAFGGTVTSDGRENTAAGSFVNLTNGVKTDRSIAYYWEGGNANKTGKNIRHYDIIFQNPALINQVTIDYFNNADGIKHREQDIALDVILADDSYVRVAEKHNLTDVASTQEKSLTLNFEEKTAKGIRITANCIQSVSYTGTTAVSAFLAYSEVSAYYNEGVPSEVPYTGIETATVTGSEIPLYSTGGEPEVQLTNVALGKTVTTSEQLSDYAPERLTDGNSSYTAETNTNAIARWATLDRTAYFEVDLESATKINQIAVFLTQWERGNLPKDMAVDVRTADGVYHRVAELHNIDYSGKQQLTFSFEEIDAVAFRVTGKATRNGSNGGNFRLMELEAYYYPELPEELLTGTEKDTDDQYNIPVPEPLLDNLALGKEVTANEVLSTPSITYKAEFLTDGNNDYFAGTETNAITKWVSTTKQGWYEVEFGKSVNFNQVAVFLTKWQTEYLPKDMAIDVRDAEGVYHRVAEMHNIDYTGRKKLTFSFEECEAVAFRVTGNAYRNASSDNFRLMELEAYYYPNMPEELITGITKDSNEKYNISVPEPLLTNLAAGKKVTANETITVGDPNKGTAHTYEASFLTDGNTDYYAGTDKNAITKYTVSAKLGWYEVDFGDTTKFNQVAVFLTKWEPQYLPKDIAIDVRTADGVYLRVAEMHNIDYTALRQLTFSFEETSGVAFRVTGNASRNDQTGNFRLLELEAYYYPNMPEELITGITKDSNEKYNIPVPEPILTNLAAGKKVTANETLTAKDGKGKEITYYATNLTDGNTDYYADTDKNAITQWISPTKTGWYEVDFGEMTTFNQVTIFLTQWEKDYRPLDIAIDVRLADGSYKRVAEMHDIQYADNKQLTFSFKTEQAVAFRVTGNATRNAKSANFRLMELEAYYYPNMPDRKLTGTKKDANAKYNIELPEPMMKNLAANMEVTANKPVQGYPAGNLTDGFKTYTGGTEKTAITSWIGKKKIGWFEVNFKQPTKINKVEVTLSRWEIENLPKDVALEVKLEDGTYVRVAELHDIDYQGIRALTFYFAEQKAVAFRFIGNASRNASSGNFRLLELEAFYYPGLPESKYTGVNEDENPLYNIKAEDMLGDSSTTNVPSVSGDGDTQVFVPSIQKEASFNLLEDTMGLFIIFCVTAGFVLIAFAVGSGSTVAFLKWKIKRRNQI